MTSRAIGTALALAILAAVGCGRTIAPGVTERADGAVVVETGGQVAAFAQNGESVAPPKSWPSDVPIYAGATISIAQEGAGFASVVLASKDKLATIGDYYAKTLPENGWTIQSTTNAGDVLVVSATKEQRNCSLSVASDEFGNQITISVTGPAS